METNSDRNSMSMCLQQVAHDVLESPAAADAVPRMSSHLPLDPPFVDDPSLSEPIIFLQPETFVGGASKLRAVASAPELSECGVRESEAPDGTGGAP